MMPIFHKFVKGFLQATDTVRLKLMENYFLPDAIESYLVGIQGWFLVIFGRSNHSGL